MADDEAAAFSGARPSACRAPRLR